MFSPRGSFSSFSVNDVAQAKAFYGQGIARGMGPDIAWFTDPAGNVISVIKGGGLLA